MDDDKAYLLTDDGELVELKAGDTYLNPLCLAWDRERSPEKEKEAEIAWHFLKLLLDSL